MVVLVHPQSTFRFPLKAFIWPWILFTTTENSEVEIVYLFFKSFNVIRAKGTCTG